jgi:polysaccharide biosynthesis protein PslG
MLPAAPARACASVAMLASAAACSLPGPAVAAGPANEEFYGVNPGDLFRLPQSAWDTHLSAVAAGGVQVVRMGAWWSDLEPGPPVDGQHRYSWTEIDQRVAALARHGLRWEPLLCFSATWGAQVDGDYTAAPAGADNFAAFAGALARRYGPDGSFWREHPDLPALPVKA